MTRSLDPFEDAFNQALTRFHCAQTDIDAAQDILHKAAIRIANEVADTYNAAFKTREKNEKPRYFVRVKEDRVNVVTIEWALRKYFKTKAGDRVKAHKYIKRGDNLEIPVSMFPLASPWERELIQWAESRFGKIRELSILLAALTNRINRKQKRPGRRQMPKNLHFENAM